MKRSIQFLGYFILLVAFVTFVEVQDYMHRIRLEKSPDNPVSEAIKENRTEDALRFIEQDKKYLYATDKSGESPIEIAIRMNNFLVVKKLIENGVSPNQRGALGDPALFDAVVNDNVDLQIVEYLLQTGGNPNLKNHRSVRITEFASGKRLELLYKYSEKNKNYQYNSAPIINKIKD